MTLVLLSVYLIYFQLFIALENENPNIWSATDLNQPYFDLSEPPKYENLNENPFNHKYDPPF